MFLSLVSAQKSTIDRAHLMQLITAGLSKVAPGLAAWTAEQLFVTVIRYRPPGREERWADGATRFTVPSPHGHLAAWKWGSRAQNRAARPRLGRSRAAIGRHGSTSGGRGSTAWSPMTVPSHGRSPGRQSNLFKLSEGLGAVVAKAVGPLGLA